MAFLEIKREVVAKPTPIQKVSLACEEGDAVRTTSNHVLGGKD